MKTKLIQSGTVLFTLAAGISAVRAQDDAQDDGPWWGRLGISYRPAFNITANFSGLGGFTSPNPGPAGATPVTGPAGTVLRQYADGFIGVDVSGNAGGETTYWGFNSESQVSDGDILMHEYNSTVTGSTGDVGNNPQHGMEMSYFQPLYEKGRWRWGVEGAFNWTPINIEQGQTLAGTVEELTQGFALNGVIPPASAPYVGPVNGPGAPELSTTAINEGTSTEATTISGWEKINANLFGVRIGPYVEYGLFDWLSVDLSGGFSTGIVDSRFEYDDVVTIAGVGSQTDAGSERSCGWVYGGYVRGQVNVEFYKSASVFVGGEFNSLSDFTQSSGPAQARLNLRGAVYLTAGVGWSF